MFLAVSKKDMVSRGWKQLDIILITGDAYVDHPSYGAAVIGRVLGSRGYKVGIISQPDWRDIKDFQTLGRPGLFFGITGGNTDSMVANYTANKRKRKTDKYSPGNLTGKRPDRAVIVYANRVREAFKDSVIVIGGIEASLRRFAHYDYWSGRVRRSILMDSRADMLVYGMGEKQVLDIAARMEKGEKISDIKGVKGTCCVLNGIDHMEKRVEIPSYEKVALDKNMFNKAFAGIYGQMDPFTALPVCQKHGTKYVVQFPPPGPLTKKEIDQVYELPYEYGWHPDYDNKGGVKGFETVRYSITSHRGCPGECSFCSIYFHQGRIIVSRSSGSILKEARKISSRKDFRGTITDIGGPTSNLYGAYCSRWRESGYCRDKKCLIPEKCPGLKTEYDKAVKLYDEMLEIPGIKHVFIGSGFRYDLFLDASGKKYLKSLCEKHISGYIKVAPEHCSEKVLKIMNKTSFKKYERFVQSFMRIRKEIGKKIFIVNYFISAHPGSGAEDALDMAIYLRRKKILPEQIQDFMPTPMTLSTAMFYSGKDPFSDRKVHVPGTSGERKIQRALLQPVTGRNIRLIKETLKNMEKEHLMRYFPKIPEKNKR